MLEIRRNETEGNVAVWASIKGITTVLGEGHTELSAIREARTNIDRMRMEIIHLMSVASMAEMRRIAQEEAEKAQQFSWD